MAKKNFSFENNFDKVIEKIRDKPTKVLNILGSTLTREVKSNIKSSKSSRRGMLANSIGFWARKQEKDLQIGFKMSIGAINKPSFPGIVGSYMAKIEEDPILPVVVKNTDLIVKSIAEALDEIRKE